MPITLEIRNYWSADIPDVRTWKPRSLKEVYYHLGFDVAETGVDGSHDFGVRIATPAGMQAVLKRRPGFAFPDRNLLVFSRYSWRIVSGRLNRILRDCSRDTWEESIACPQRYWHWEYEDYEVVD
jgi:hypothetical protein